MSKTEICWATDTWNPVTGCAPISEGCKNCYARRMAKRLAGRHGYPEAPNEFQPTLHWDKLYQPLHWRKPRVVFVCSMGDLFHEGVMDHWRGRVWEVMWNEDAQAHTFLVLTKRPQVMADFVAQPRWGGEVPPNVWLGVSVETRDRMWRVEELLKIPAAKRFVSFEPLLGPIDTDELEERLDLEYYVPMEQLREGWDDGARHIGLDGVIVGGESGPGARPMHPDWARGIRDQCVEAGVAFTFKQHGEWIESHAEWPNLESAPALYVDVRGDCPSKTYSAMMHDPVRMIRVGKSAAGRLLDGQVWDEFPWKLLEEGR